MILIYCLGELKKIMFNHILVKGILFCIFLVLIYETCHWNEIIDNQLCSEGSKIQYIN